MAAVGHPTQTPPQYRKKFVTVLTGFVILFVLLDQTPSLLASHDLTAGFLLASAVLVVAAVGSDMLLFGRALPSAWRNLGFGRPETRTLLVTTLVGVLVMGFFPIFSWVTGAPFALPDRWLWVLMGLFAVHGIAEEVLFRGFAFHNLRAGRTFGRAALLSVLLFAVAHVYLLTYMPVTLALFATVLSLSRVGLSISLPVRARQQHHLGTRRFAHSSSRYQLFRRFRSVPYNCRYRLDDLVDSVGVPDLRVPRTPVRLRWRCLNDLSRKFSELYAGGIRAVPGMALAASW